MDINTVELEAYMQERWPSALTEPIQAQVHIRPPTSSSYKGPYTVILLSGWSTAGKDTIGSVFCNKYGFKRYAFADCLKDLVAKELNIDISLCNTQRGKDTVIKGRTVREHLITCGEETRAAHGGMCWADLVSTQILADPYHQRIVITDWRNIQELIGLQKRLPQDTLYLPCRVEREGLYVSPVADMTEYGLTGFPFVYVFKNRVGSDKDSSMRYVSHIIKMFVRYVLTYATLKK